MDKSDGQVFLERLSGLSELFNAKLSPVVQQIYFNALKDLDLTAVLEAMNTCVGTARFMPKPAEIRQLVVGDDEDHAEQAWLAWRAAARQVGSYSSILTDDPAMAETLTAVFGGWVEACSVELSPEMWSAKRKEFGRVYRVVASRGLAGHRYLTGVVELSNRSFPERPHPLALIERGAVSRVPAGRVDEFKTLAAAKPRGVLLGFERMGAEG